MPKKHAFLLILILSALCANSQKVFAHSAEIFAKGNISKSFVSSSGDQWILTVAGSTGVAFLLLPQIRVEGRFMVRYSEQNQQADSYGKVVWQNITTQTNIYSVGFDIDILSDKNPIQPFVYIGGGYIESMSTYIQTANGIQSTTRSYGPSANGGLGFRVKIGRSVAFEVEGFAYAQGVDKPHPLIDWTGSVGIRFFL